MRDKSRSRFALEIAFIVAVAIALGAVGAEPAVVIVGMLFAWLLASTFEWAASRTGTVPLAALLQARQRRARGGRRREPPRETPPQPEHVRVIPDEPDPAAQPVVAHARSEPEALVGAAPPVEPVSAAERHEDTPPVDVAPAMEAEPPPPTPLAEPVEPDETARPVLTAVPAPPPEPEPVAEPQPAAAASPEPERVVAMPPPSHAVEWNLWELERVARERAGQDVLRDEEWGFLLVYLREFASSDGMLPVDFDSLVRESFAELLPAVGRR